MPNTLFEKNLKEKFGTRRERWSPEKHSTTPWKDLFEFYCNNADCMNASQSRLIRRLKQTADNLEKLDDGSRWFAKKICGESDMRRLYRKLTQIFETAYFGKDLNNDTGLPVSVEELTTDKNYPELMLEISGNRNQTLSLVDSVALNTSAEEKNKEKLINALQAEAFSLVSFISSIQVLNASYDLVSEKPVDPDKLDASYGHYATTDLNASVMTDLNTSMAADQRAGKAGFDNRIETSYALFKKNCEKALSNEYLDDEKRDAVERCMVAAGRIYQLKESISDNTKSIWLDRLSLIANHIDAPDTRYWETIATVQNDLNALNKQIDKRIQRLEKKAAKALKAQQNVIDSITVVTEEDAARLKEEQGKLLSLKETYDSIKQNETEILKDVVPCLGAALSGAANCMTYDHDTVIKNRKEQRERIQKDAKEYGGGDGSYVNILATLARQQDILTTFKVDEARSKGIENSGGGLLKLKGKDPSNKQYFANLIPDAYLQEHINRTQAFLEAYRELRKNIGALSKPELNKQFDKLKNTYTQLVLGNSLYEGITSDLASKDSKIAEGIHKENEVLKSAIQNWWSEIEQEIGMRDDCYSRLDDALKKSMRDYFDEREFVNNEIRRFEKDNDGESAYIYMQELNRHLLVVYSNEESKKEFEKEQAIRDQTDKYLRNAQEGSFDELISDQMNCEDGQEPEACKRAVEALRSKGNEDLLGKYVDLLTGLRTKDRVAAAAAAKKLEEDVRKETYGKIGVLKDDEKAIRTIANIVSEKQNDYLLETGSKDALKHRRYDELLNNTGISRDDLQRKENDLLKNYTDPDRTTYRTSLEEDPEVRLNTKATLSEDHKVSITVHEDYLERRRQEAVRKEYEDEFSRRTGALLSGSKFYELVVYLNQEQERRGADRGKDALLLLDSFTDIRKDLVGRIEKNPDQKKAFDAATHEYAVRTEYQEELQNNLKPEHDAAALAKSVYERKTALKASQEQDDRYRADVLNMFETSLLDKMGDDKRKLYHDEYFKLEKQADIRKRLTAVYANNDPEEYEKEAARIREECEKTLGLGPDFAKSCIESFEGDLNKDRKTILDDFRTKRDYRKTLLDTFRPHVESRNMAALAAAVYKEQTELRNSQDKFKNAEDEKAFAIKRDVFNEVQKSLMGQLELAGPAAQQQNANQAGQADAGQQTLAMAFQKEMREIGKRAINLQELSDVMQKLRADTGNENANYNDLLPSRTIAQFSMEKDLTELAELFDTQKTGWFFNSDSGKYTDAKGALGDYLSDLRNANRQLRENSERLGRGEISVSEFKEAAAGLLDGMREHRDRLHDTMEIYAIHATNGNQNTKTLGEKTIDQMTKTAGAARLVASMGILEKLDAVKAAENPANNRVRTRGNKNVEAERTKETSFHQLYKEIKGNAGNEGAPEDLAQRRIENVRQTNRRMKENRWVKPQQPGNH